MGNGGDRAWAELVHAAAGQGDRDAVQGAFQVPQRGRLAGSFFSFRCPWGLGCPGSALRFGFCSTQAIGDNSWTCSVRVIGVALACGIAIPRDCDALWRHSDGMASDAGRLCISGTWPPRTMTHARLGDPVADTKISKFSSIHS